MKHINNTMFALLAPIIVINQALYCIPDNGPVILYPTPVRNKSVSITDMQHSLQNIIHPLDPFDEPLILNGINHEIPLQELITLLRQSEKNQSHVASLHRFDDACDNPYIQALIVLLGGVGTSLASVALSRKMKSRFPELMIIAGALKGLKEAGPYLAALGGSLIFYLLLKLLQRTIRDVANEKMVEMNQQFRVLEAALRATMLTLYAEQQQNVNNTFALRQRRIEQHYTVITGALDKLAKNQNALISQLQTGNIEKALKGLNGQRQLLEKLLQKQSPSRAKRIFARIASPKSSTSRRSKSPKHGLKSPELNPLGSLLCRLKRQANNTYQITFLDPSQEIPSISSGTPGALLVRPQSAGNVGQLIPL